VKPYYEHAGITIYHGDCRALLPTLSWHMISTQAQNHGEIEAADPQGRAVKSGRVWVDAVITDPPYGINGQIINLRDSDSKGDYETESFEDTPNYVEAVVVPTICELLQNAKRVVLTPGQINIHKYPAPDHMGAFFYPASCSVSRWGMRLWQPIFYYGKDPYVGRLKPDGKICNDSDRLTDHPCPKPLGSWSWLVQRVTLPDETILDPFCGSGTTLLAAKNTHRRAIGIEIEEKYCEIAAKRLSQEVMAFGRAGGEAETAATT
jgi:DNA modification methylase